MGELVLFRPAGGLEQRNHRARDEDARILLFTGVRYQREDDSNAPPSHDQAASAGEGDANAPPSGGMGGGGGRRKRRG
jgi:hypothetical protein